MSYDSLRDDVRQSAESARQQKMAQEAALHRQQQEHFAADPTTGIGETGAELLPDAFDHVFRMLNEIRNKHENLLRQTAADLDRLKRY